MDKGMLIVIAGPSGVGKGTVKNELLQRNENLVESISATTRKPRAGEVEGISYYFKSEGEFDDLIIGNMFLEYCGVFERRYGTMREFVEENIDLGHDVLLEIDVQGALKVRGSKPNAIMIMLLPPSLPDLIERLQKRNTETEVEINRRFSKAKMEISQTNCFDYVVVNDTIENACKKIELIIKAEKLRSERSSDFVTKIIEN